MSAKLLKRDTAQGKTQRLQQPLAMKQTVHVQPSNPVVYAMAHRGASAGAGKHMRAQGAQRRLEKMALQKLVRRQEQ